MNNIFLNRFLFQFLELTKTENINLLQKFTQSPIPIIENVGNKKRKERNIRKTVKTKTKKWIEKKIIKFNMMPPPSPSNNKIF